MIETKQIFEIRDVTDCSIYYSLGFFLSFEEAKKAIEAHRKVDEPISPHEMLEGAGHETIVIMQIPLGWAYENPKEVFRIERIESYDELSDQMIWKTLKPNHAYSQPIQ